MNLISLTRFFSTLVFIALFSLQGCYEQTTPGANDAITDSGNNTGAGPDDASSAGSSNQPSDDSDNTANTSPAHQTEAGSGNTATTSSGQQSNTAPGHTSNSGAGASTSTDSAAKASNMNSPTAIPQRDSVTISLHPMSQAVAPTTSFTLNVSATGNKTLRYQWRKNGRVIRNAVRASYTVASATAADAGRYEVIVISGQRIVMSRTASITIEADRSASLSWAPPAKRADGTPLSEEEIAAYRIYHSNDDGSIGRDYEVDPSQQRFELDNLPRGAHHFAIATVDINGMESTLSAVVTKRIL